MRLSQQDHLTWKHRAHEGGEVGCEQEPESCTTEDGAEKEVWGPRVGGLEGNSITEFNTLGSGSGGSPWLPRVSQGLREPRSCGDN